MRFILAFLAVFLFSQEAHASYTPPLAFMAQWASTACHSTGLTGTQCANILGFADPRNFGGYCDSNFNANNSTHADDTGLQAALNSGYPVLIPNPGCKIASGITGGADGQTIFSYGSGNYYNASYLASPYIFVTDAVAGTSKNCAIDTAGYDGFTLSHITMKANYNAEGTVALCDSVGIRSPRAAAFLNIDQVSIENFGAGIGSAMTVVSGGVNACTPTGSLGNNVFQIRGHGLIIQNTCNAMYGNFSDVHLDDVFVSDSQGVCMATSPGGGGGISLSNFRCEYNFPETLNSNAYYLDGTGIYLSGFGVIQLVNVSCDHVNGSCVTIPSGAHHVVMTNVTSVDSGGNWYGQGSITNQCAYTILGATDLSATNMQALKNAVTVPYTLCIPSGTNDYITWGGTDGTVMSQTAYQNIGVTIPHFIEHVPGLVANYTGSGAFSAILAAGTQAAGGTYTPNLALSNSVSLKFGAGNLTIANPTNINAGQTYQLALTQDGTGSRTVTWGTDYNWAAGLAPTLSTAAGAKDIISCWADSSTTLECVLAVPNASP